MNLGVLELMYQNKQFKIRDEVSKELKDFTL
jgi:hypothetical protein